MPLNVRPKVVQLELSPGNFRIYQIFERLGPREIDGLGSVLGRCVILLKHSHDPVQQTKSWCLQCREVHVPVTKQRKNVSVYLF